MPAARGAPAGDNPALNAWMTCRMSQRWDIFCKVVDNFGDAGVAWRLARQLVREHSRTVRLWIDDVPSLARMVPGLDAARDAQYASGVDVRAWRATPVAAEPADGVVEAFGCGLPDDYLDAMTKQSVAPLWFVLEYLSAEAWIDDAHGLPSPHPRLPLTRTFWFPGFTPKSGGLLRERGLIEARRAFRADARAHAAFWSSIGLPTCAAGEWRVSLFCYPNPALLPLLDAWAGGDVPVTCIVPEGIATSAIDAWTGAPALRASHSCSRGRVTLHAIPFLSQDAYDRLLWACDVNFVRGEDSFVRAQWAARAFAWHIYPQVDDAHRRKLDAFVDRYLSSVDPTAAAAVRRLFRAWNDPQAASDIAEAWRAFVLARPALERHGEEWADGLAALPDLAGGLVKAGSNAV
jgi:uncharacterized repeat protein (TIGR03837 family)